MRKRLTVEGKETKIIVVETIVAIDVPNKVESEKGEKRGERRERERIALQRLTSQNTCTGSLRVQAEATCTSEGKTLERKGRKK